MPAAQSLCQQKKNRRAKRKNGGVSAHQPTRSKVTSTRTLLSRKRDSVPKAHGVVKRQSGPLLTAEQKREPDVSACLAVRSTVSRIRLCDEDPGKKPLFAILAVQRVIRICREEYKIVILPYPLRRGSTDTKRTCAICQPSSRAFRDAQEKKSSNPINRGSRTFPGRRNTRKTMKNSRRKIRKNVKIRAACHAASSMTGGLIFEPNSRIV